MAFNSLQLERPFSGLQTRTRAFYVVDKETEMSSYVTNIIADSINPNGNRVTTFLLTYPRFIHSELMTHRSFSRNAASSRAIPIDKIIEQVRTNPAMPIRWGKNGKGMQDHGVFTDSTETASCEAQWKEAANRAIESAMALKNLGLHKQIVNRVLEPFMWMTTLVTATQWENFFSLRVHKDAQPEFQHLSHLILKTYLGSQPVKKEWGEWHIPFGDRLENVDNAVRLKIATARAARTSYLTIEGPSAPEKDIALHDILAQNGHWSPFEHACQAGAEKAIGNFVGWSQYRHFFPNENRKCDLQSLVKEYELSCS